MRAEARALFEAFASATPIAPLTDSEPDLSVADAYAIQRELLDAHAAAGRPVVGRKIGLTSLAMQQQLGIDSPDFGAILGTHAFASGNTLSRAGAGMIAPKLEPELAFVLGRALRGPGLEVADVAAAVTDVLPVMEIIDSRVRDWRIRLADTVADNASCFGVVAGLAHPTAAVGDLTAVRVALSRDDVVEQEGTGAAVMGDPLAAVTWLANELGRFGEALPAGQMVLAGSFTAAIEATPARYTADFGDLLGSVSVTITA